jgi:hypothetical protein
VVHNIGSGARKEDVLRSFAILGITGGNLPEADEAKTWK